MKSTSLGGSRLPADRLVHHSEAVPAIVHIGKRRSRSCATASVSLSLARTDELRHSIGGGLKRESIFILGSHQERGGDLCRQFANQRQAIGSKAFVALRAVA